MEENYLERIKKLKSEKKITNEQLSRMTGIPLGTLSKFLAGISDSVKLSNIISVCNALDCSLDYIISGQPENTNNYTLTPGEIKFIEDYRRLDQYGKELVVLVLGKENEPCDHKYDVTGSLCENNDKFAVDRMLPKIDIGDYLVIHDTGAHGYAMGYNYNGKLKSPELLLKEDGSVQMIRRGETPRDYFATFDFCDILKDMKY